ncbi:MAG: ATP-dependent DNA helicase RecG [Clostridia bacterium]|nr:ATP-dependent DNA helicase RecG [Clostridia bacterium]
MIEQSTNIKYLKGVGEKRAKMLEKLGIFTVGDLLRHYPRSYRQWSDFVEISKANIGDTCCIKAIAGKTPSGVKIRQGMTIFKTDATDGTDVIKITIFNNKYMAQSIEQGKEYYFYGKISGNLYSKEMTVSEIADVEKTKSVSPIYPLTQGINSKYISKLVSTALSQGSDILKEVIPTHIRESLCLMEINKAIKEIHFPQSEDLLSEARRRLVFEELFVLQIGLMKLKGHGKEKTQIVLKGDFTNQFFESLPFTPTNAQKRAINECIEQMQSGYLMNRLLQGDVGSGKTAVAASLIYNMVKSGYQAAFMAPTEILAIQHYNSICSFFKSFGFNIALLTGATTAKEKREIKAKLKSGETDIIIGTHALIQPDVEFSNIGLVITDEQHRFGVRQRNALLDKGNVPHTLVMSATPIPRTLALMIFGDLDISVLDELPPGRQPIETYCIDSTKRERAYNYIKKHLDRGLQGYIVCPLVEEGNDETLAAAKKYAEDLASKQFSGYSVGLLHGKMKPKDKDKIMAEFVSGKVQLLVSTTVIEVGVDVPNAVIMVIENSERFGLSQLHQLRGRIGRGEHQSTCILISDATNDNAVKRMNIMKTTADGFKIADEDLALRGPGDFFGDKQHGLPELKIAMLTDTFILKEANTFALKVLEEDNNLDNNQNLKEAVEKLFNKNKLLN